MFSQFSKSAGGDWNDTAARLPAVCRLQYVRAIPAVLSVWRENLYFLCLVAVAWELLNLAELGP